MDCFSLSIYDLSSTGVRERAHTNAGAQNAYDFHYAFFFVVGFVFEDRCAQHQQNFDRIIISIAKSITPTQTIQNVLTIII